MNKCPMTPIEALNTIYYNAKDCYGEYEVVKESLEALEIIKKKGVNVALVLTCNNAKEYNKHYDIDFNKLTYDEFDSLKEVLEND